MPVHNVFHVSLLKEYKPGTTPPPPPPPIHVDGEQEYEAERILTHREKKCRSSKHAGNNTRKEYLLEWTGYGPEHNTWEPEANLKNCQELLQEYWSEQARRQALTTARLGKPRQVVKRRHIPEETAAKSANKRQHTATKRQNTAKNLKP
jgi:hypothetical protein